MAANIKATSSSDHSTSWTPEETFCSEGLGVEAEGKIIELRFHTVTARDRVERYIAVVFEMQCAFEVTLDKYGVENPVDPRQYKTDPRSLDFDALHERVAPPESLLGKAYLDKLHPNKEGVFEFWALASTDARKWEVGEEMHFKTQGNSFFIKTFFHTKFGNFGHLEGGQVMNQMSKLSDHLTNMGPLEQDLAEGCDSDEWSE